MALVVDGGGLVNKGGALGTGAACCCTPPPPPCDCDCYEVAVNGKFGFNPDNYSDPNNEGWASGFVYECGSGGASYTKLDYPVRIGGININIDGAQAVVRQDGDSGCVGGGYEWPNATLTFGEDGCPTGVDLGEPVFTCSDSADPSSCDPMFGDWDGTPEERCQKFRDFLDAHPPEFNFRSCTGACCIPELEPCVYVTGPCPEGGDCGDGFICNEDGNCQGFGNFPIGDCPGAVIGDPISAECQDGLTQSECEATYGTYHPGQTCDESPCDGFGPLP
jgi:hypothetical protein